MEKARLILKEVGATGLALKFITMWRTPNPLTNREVLELAAENSISYDELREVFPYPQPEVGASRQPGWGRSPYSCRDLSDSLHRLAGAARNRLSSCCPFCHSEIGADTSTIRFYVCGTRVRHSGIASYDRRCG